MTDKIIFKIAIKTLNIYNTVFKQKSGEAMPCDFENEIYRKAKAKYFDKQDISKDIILFAMLLKNYDDYTGLDNLELLAETSLLNESDIKIAVELKDKFTEYLHKII
jgi:hypothetical protein